MIDKSLFLKFSVSYNNFKEGIPKKIKITPGITVQINSKDWSSIVFLLINLFIINEIILKITIIVIITKKNIT